MLILTPDVAAIDEKADFVILLGGGISKDGILPDSVIKRVEKTAEYLAKNPECICVVTGGMLDWFPISEAPELKRQLVLAGVSPDKILVEDQAKDTIQNLEVLDIFMPGEEFAHRIVFDFDTISQIKSFIPETQASVNSFDELIIYPMKEIIWTEELF